MRFHHKQTKLSKLVIAKRLTDGLKQIFTRRVAGIGWEAAIQRKKKE